MAHHFMSADTTIETIPDDGMFVSAVLTPGSREELLRRFQPAHAIVHAHHVTMAYKPDAETLEYYRKFEGKRLRIPVIAFAADDKALAVLVGAESENDFPHITISVAEGVEARYSNDLLRDNKFQQIPIFTVEADVVIEPLSSVSLLPTDSGGLVR